MSKIELKFGRKVVAWEDNVAFFWYLGKAVKNIFE